MSNWFRKADIVLYAVLLSCILFSFFLPSLLFSNDGQTVEISTPDGTAAYVLNEDRNLKINSNGISFDVEIKSGNVSVTSATCPDKICLATGEISKAGESVICVPAQMQIRIVGQHNTEGVDAVAK